MYNTSLLLAKLARLTAEKAQRTTYLHLLGTGLTSMCYHWAFYVGALGLKLRSFHLYSKHFTDRAIHLPSCLPSSGKTIQLSIYQRFKAVHNFIWFGIRASLVLLIQDVQSSKIQCVYSGMELGDL